MSDPVPRAAEIRRCPGSPPVQPCLVTEVLAGYRLEPNGIHGPAHWLRVRANGLALAARTPGACIEVVELFALLHDSRREDEGHDLGHGERAAAYAQRLVDAGMLKLDASGLDLLVSACAWHEHGRVSAEPTIGCCWDADRLELSRLNRRPIARFLSTSAAHDAHLQAAAWQRGYDQAVDRSDLAAWGLEAVLAGGGGG